MSWRRGAACECVCGRWVGQCRKACRGRSSIDPLSTHAADFHRRAAAAAAAAASRALLFLASVAAADAVNEQ